MKNIHTRGIYILHKIATILINECEVMTKKRNRKLNNKSEFYTIAGKAGTIKKKKGECD